jgi:hypothetical protein
VPFSEILILLEGECLEETSGLLCFFLFGQRLLSGRTCSMNFPIAFSMCGPRMLPALAVPRHTRDSVNR